MNTSDFDCDRTPWHLYCERRRGRSAGMAFETKEAAEETKRSMERISIMTGHFSDMWRIVYVGQNEQYMTDKQRRALERARRLEVEIEKSREQLRKRRKKR